MDSKKQIEEMAKVLKAYTKKNNIMASHVILDGYAEELYKAGFCRQSEVIEDFAERLKNKLDISVCGYSSEEVTSDVENTIDDLVEEMKCGAE